MTITVSGLPLLAYKIGPNLFDLSSELHYVSLRDQMHRGVALAEALFAGRQFGASSNEVLIVGAGVAGVSAGIVLARHGVDVVMIDSSAAAPFALQRNVSQRYVGPYMYEWPLEVHDSQRMPPQANTPLAQWGAGAAQPPLSFPFAGPERPDQYVLNWDADLRREMSASGRTLSLLTGIDGIGASIEINRWLTAQRNAHLLHKAAYSNVEVGNLTGKSWLNGANVTLAVHPRFVILATGMGVERTDMTDQHGTLIANGTQFWADDELLRRYCGESAPPSVVILGGGDGALQDTLRALTGDAHPLATIRKLDATWGAYTSNRIRQRVASLEHQHAHATIWETASRRGSSANDSLDKAHQELAKDLARDPRVVASVVQELRSDVESVRLCVREQHIGKAYALNRFLIHLFEQCFSKSTHTHVGHRFQVRRRVRCVTSKPLSGGQTALDFDDGTTLQADIAVVRIGIDASSRPSTWLGLDAKDSVNRQDLSSVPLPLYFPPTA